MSEVTKNLAQTLTEEQQKRSFFTVVASNFTMADGTKQNPHKAMVRLRNGEMVYVKDLPGFDTDNPQPNGDYIIPLNNNHSDAVESQAGAMWLAVEDNYLKALIVFSNNDAAKNLIPLARDGFLQFSTEGYLEDMSDSGEYGDFWITAVAPVMVGNDPSTQIILENVYKNLLEIKDYVSAAVSAQTTEETETKEMTEETKENAIEVQAKPEPVVPAVVTNEVKPVFNVVTGKDWLKTDNAMEKFVDALKLGDPTQTVNTWTKTLKENAIEFNPDSVTILPELLVTEIDTIITTQGEIYNRLNHTGLMFAMGAAVKDLEAAKVRARGNGELKISQEITAEPRLIIPCAFYKFFSEAYDIINRNGGLNGAIVTFVARELAMKVLELIERAVVVGGVLDDKGATISPQYVRPISADTVADGMYGDVYTQGTTESLPEALSTAAAMVLSGGAVTLITTRARAAKMPYLTVGEAGIPMFLNSADRGSVNVPMVDAVIAPLWLTEADLGGGVGYLVDLNAYKTVGEAGTQSFYQFHLRTNEHDFEAVKMFGGALSKPKAAIKVIPAPVPGVAPLNEYAPFEPTI
jgi:hypothetical protein